MTEDGFADDRLTFLILEDVTLRANSIELREYPAEMVEATRTRLISERYAFVTPGPTPPRGAQRIDRGRLTDKGAELFQRLKHKLGSP